jgi:hypothetical protein
VKTITKGNAAAKKTDGRNGGKLKLPVPLKVHLDAGHSESDAL